MPSVRLTENQTTADFDVGAPRLLRRAKELAQPVRPVAPSYVRIRVAPIPIRFVRLYPRSRLQHRGHIHEHD